MTKSDAPTAARQSAEELAEPGWRALDAAGDLAALVAAAQRRLQRELHLGLRGPHPVEPSR